MIMKGKTIRKKISKGIRKIIRKGIMKRNRMRIGKGEQEEYQ